MNQSSPRRALVVGVTGITGQTIAGQLLEAGWEVHGLSRRAQGVPTGVHSIQADLLDLDAMTTALSGLRPEIVFMTAWIKKDSEAENIEVNGATIRNLLAALKPDGGVRHVALQTGLKHYLGPFDDYATAVTAETPFHEDEPRLPNPNFYYTQEDELFAAAADQGFTWSVHRSHTIFGYAVDNAMNMVLTLSTYAEICRELGTPFTFPGSQTQWNGVTDVTDSDLLAEQLIWAATTPAAENQALNIANGDVFRWRWMWPQIAEHFGVEWQGPGETPNTLVSQMADSAPVWKRIAEANSLAETDIAKLASWWHSDSDLGRNVECFTDMTKSRELGFLGFKPTPASFFDKVARYRAAGILPTH
jgi:nucleoside-diphosphate-sugar epimerase